jgi:hypothetical protein
MQNTLDEIKDGQYLIWAEGSAGELTHVDTQTYHEIPIEKLGNKKQSKQDIKK